MKTIQEYLEECKEMACHNLLCYSKTYGMDTPKDGCELAFAGAQRDLEIVELLISREQNYQTSMQAVRSNLDLSFSKEDLQHTLLQHQYERKML